MIYILSCEKIEKGGGIYSFDLNTNGQLIKKDYYACDRPMYAVKCKQGLCVLLRQPFDNDNNSGYFFIDDSLCKATKIKSTKGIVACHLTVNNNDIYIVNYLSGNIVKNGEKAVNRVGKSVNVSRQEMPHTHFIGKTPDGYFAVCDLGTDTLAFYDDDLNLISESKVPLGYGIRHLVFSKDGKYIYTINELVPSISVFGYKEGAATLLNTVKIECENGNASGAAIRLSQDGKYLYVSVRGENIICVYEISGENLKILQKFDCGGDSPRDFDIICDKMIVCNEKSANVAVFDMKKGFISKIKESVPLSSTLCVIELSK